MSTLRSMIEVAQHPGYSPREGTLSSPDSETGGCREGVFHTFINDRMGDRKEHHSAHPTLPQGNTVGITLSLSDRLPF